MALIKCEECGKEISSRAAVCPHCGCPVTSATDEPTEVLSLENESSEIEPIHEPECAPQAELTLDCLSNHKLQEHVYKVYIDGSSWGKVSPGYMLVGDFPIGKHRIKVIDKSDNDMLICKNSIYLDELGLSLELNVKTSELSIFDDDDEDVSDDRNDENSTSYVLTAFSFLLSIGLSIWVLYCFCEFESSFSNVLNDALSNPSSGSEFFDSLSLILADGIVSNISSQFNKLFIPWFLISGLGAVFSVVSVFLRSLPLTIACFVCELFSLCYAFSKELTKNYSGGIFTGIYYGVVFISFFILVINLYLHSQSEK